MITFNALEYNAGWANPEVVKYLIDHGAEMGNAINNAAAFQNYEVVKILLENGANPNQPDNYNSPLDAALFCCSHHEETPIETRLKLAKLLIHYGAKTHDSQFLDSLNRSFEKYHIKIDI